MEKSCKIILIVISLILVIGLVVFLVLFLGKDKNAIKYGVLSEKFREIKSLSTKELGNKIGGKVKVNTDGGFFTNTCCIRMSYAFNYAGYEFKQNEYGTTSSWGDGKYYIFRVKDFKSFLDDKYSSKKYIYQDKSKLDSKKGVIVFEDCNFSTATGHVDLYNGNEVEGTGYFNECSTYTLYQFD